MTANDDSPESGGTVVDISAAQEIMKPKPKSAFSEGEYSSPDELSKISFTSSPLIFSPVGVVPDPAVAPTPSAKKNILAALEKDPGTLYSFSSDGKRIPILPTSNSRQGRDHQRWDRCKNTNELIRLATGCIPITNDGRILFCSSSKKKEWILPKGGWESDENIEQSAVRETYEEAGVLGTLGARLNDVTFETKKEKKRKLEISRRSSKIVGATHVESQPPSESTAQSKPDDSAQSPVKSTHSLVRVAFFVLYISEVLSEWPESGRSRKILDIDEAIATVKREELKAVLLDLKQRGLHLVAKNTSDVTSASIEKESGNSTS